MIKDIALALEIGSSRDAARDYALSVASAFNAHLAAIGFDYAPVLPPMDTVSAVPFDILDAEREANRKAASNATARFEEAGTARRRVGRVALGRGHSLRRTKYFRVDRPHI